MPPLAQPLTHFGHGDSCIKVLLVTDKQSLSGSAHPWLSGLNDVLFSQRTAACNSSQCEETAALMAQVGPMSQFKLWLELIRSRSVIKITVYTVLKNMVNAIFLMSR